MQRMWNDRPNSKIPRSEAILSASHTILTRGWVVTHLGISIRQWFHGNVHKKSGEHDEGCVQHLGRCHLMHHLCQLELETYKPQSTAEYRSAESGELSFLRLFWIFVNLHWNHGKNAIFKQSVIWVDSVSVNRNFVDLSHQVQIGSCTQEKLNTVAATVVSGGRVRDLFWGRKPSPLYMCFHWDYCMVAVNAKGTAWSHFCFVFWKAFGGLHLPRDWQKLLQVRMMLSICGIYHLLDVSRL